MKVTKKQKKEFALAQVAPYFKDPSLCGYKDNNCVYLTNDGKMCVAGKNMISPTTDMFGDIKRILKDFTQEQIFKPEVVGILTADEWLSLQGIHDAIAYKSEGNLSCHIDQLNLFTLAQLRNYAKKL